MQISVNGQQQEFDADLTVAELVAQFELEPKHVAVEVNCDLVPRRCFAETKLADGDEVEIVTLVGGG
jgi:thiamine biosynthesis protein ThiS